MATPLYLIETRSPRIRKTWFLEIDRDHNSREFALREVRFGEVVKVLEVIEPCEDFPRGQVLDVTAELEAEAGIHRDDYRTPFTGQDAIDWQNDRRRALQMSEG